MLGRCWDVLGCVDGGAGGPVVVLVAQPEMAVAAAAAVEMAVGPAFVLVVKWR